MIDHLKNLRCWIITEDGLVGTENQCLGVSEALEIPPHIKRIKLREPWKTLSPYLGLEQWWSFDPTFYPPWPDLVIASGRKSIAASRFIKKVTDGACITVQIQDPKVHPGHFDLVAVPAHDKMRGKNVLVTTASPNRITPQKLKDEAQKFPELSQIKSPKLAVMIGGNSKTHTFTVNKAQALIQHLNNLDAGLMITMSRRTPADIAALLRKELKGPNIYFWDGAGNNPYFAFLEHADALLVTSDSASMISEAATTGKPVYKFDLEGGSEKFGRLYARLKKKGILRTFKGTLEHWDYERLQDTQKIAQTILKLLEKRMEKPIADEETLDNAD